ncbi:MAG: aminoacyl-histidine dipeptidase [Clostridia bacterium]|nr:aminoacyl-histidine dipeptidase [Clostridia bacterium]
MKLTEIQPREVFRYFEEISGIPRGSGNQEKISDYCLEFAREHGFKAERDSAFNVIIYKDGTPGYEAAEPVILQGHLDMVCQKEEDHPIDFEKDGLDLCRDGDYIKARGTTLGGDNGIAVAMMLAILASNTISHPPIEAVFTTDEEVGMLGAMALDMSKLKGRKMINMDSEEEDILTVSCAGGSEISMEIPLKREEKSGVYIRISVKGFKGGHSGVEIHKGRINANGLLARILQNAKSVAPFSLVSIDGGDKANAIPRSGTAILVTEDAAAFLQEVDRYGTIVKEELSAREPDFVLETEILPEPAGKAMVPEFSERLLYLLLCAPNGVQEMSVEIPNLVETSLNLGVLKTEAEQTTLCFALRSNKQSALTALEQRLLTFASCAECKTKLYGQYPPWEFKSDSALQTLYKEAYQKQFGKEPKVEAIHAGLECGVFAAALSGMDCISIGPNLYDVHTTEERMSISSVERIYGVVLDVLKSCQ